MFSRLESESPDTFSAVSVSSLLRSPACFSTMDRYHLRRRACSTGTVCRAWGWGGGVQLDCVTMHVWVMSTVLVHCAVHLPKEFIFYTLLISNNSKKEKTSTPFFFRHLIHLASVYSIISKDLGQVRPKKLANVFLSCFLTCFSQNLSNLLVFLFSVTDNNAITLQWPDPVIYIQVSLRMHTLAKTVTFKEKSLQCIVVIG